MNLKVAILQNQIIKGGRFSVIARMIKNLNSLGIIPDIITQRIGFDLAAVNDLYGYEINAKLNRIGRFNKYLPEIDILAFNKSVQKEIIHYDLVINSSNTSHFLSHPNLIEYIHFPRFTRIKSKEALNSVLGIRFLIKLLELKFVQKAYESNQYPKAVLLANSSFTADSFRKAYKFNDFIEVLYPPIDIPEIQPKFVSSNNVVSLGRIHSSKKQLEVVQLAKQLRDFNFHIVGFAKKDDKYVQECFKYAAKYSLENVQFHINVSAAIKNEILSNASYFLHLLDNEPFGISTVQAIANGCIPIVPDSGGQKEIVNDQNLRFDSIKKIGIMLQMIHKFPEHQKKDLFNSHFEHIKKFSASTFDIQFLDLIKNYAN